MAVYHGNRPIRGSVRIVDVNGSIIFQGDVSEAAWTEKRDVHPIMNRGELLCVEEGEHTVDFELKVSGYSMEFSPKTAKPTDAELWRMLDDLDRMRATRDITAEQHMSQRRSLLAQMTCPQRPGIGTEVPGARNFLQGTVWANTQARKQGKNAMFAALYGGNPELALKFWAESKRPPINHDVAGYVGKFHEVTQNGAQRTNYVFDLEDSWTSETFR